MRRLLIKLGISMHYRLELSNLVGLEFIAAFTAIPASVTSLKLCHNHLGDKSGAELAQAFAAIPASVTSLNLRGNNLDNKLGAELTQAFAAIPATVTSLDLGLNDLGDESGAELAQAFAAIPPTVTSLDLSSRDEDLSFIFAEENQALFQNTTITTLHLPYERMKDVPKAHRSRLVNVFPHLTELFFVDNEGNAIQLNSLSHLNFIRSFGVATKVPRLTEFSIFSTRENLTAPEIAVDGYLDLD